MARSKNRPRNCVVIYCRVSTEEQARSGAGIAAQEAECLAYAERQGWNVVDVVREEAVSGSRHPTRRTGWTRAMGLLAECDRGVLLVRRMDRISRKLRHQLDVFEAAASKRAGWDIATTDGNVDTASATGRFQIQILAAAAEYELGLIGERTKEALAAKKAGGKRLGRPIEPEHEPVRQLIRAMRDAGVGPTATATALNADGWTTATGLPWSKHHVIRVRRSLSLDDAATEPGPLPMRLRPVEDAAS